MGLFKNSANHSLVKDKYKKEWADKIYLMDPIGELIDKYFLSYKEEVSGLIPDSILNDNSSFMKAIVGKTFIEIHIERIFQSAKNDEIRLKGRNIGRWDTPFGIAQGAVNLIKPTDLREKRMLFYLIGLVVIRLNFNAPTQFIGEGMRMALENNNWTKEEIDDFANL